MAWQALRLFQVWSLQHLAKLARESFKPGVFPTAGKDLLSIKYIPNTMPHFGPKPCLLQAKGRDGPASPFPHWIAMFDLLHEIIHED